MKPCDTGEEGGGDLVPLGSLCGGLEGDLRAGDRRLYAGGDGVASDAG
jgi:hypothetical protein